MAKEAYISRGGVGGKNNTQNAVSKSARQYDSEDWDSAMRKAMKGVSRAQIGGSSSSVHWRMGGGKTLSYDGVLGKNGKISHYDTWVSDKNGNTLSEKKGLKTPEALADAAKNLRRKYGK